ncbi:hypothetical protein [Epilithonimonas sp.]|uniref:hypothetical protein n=1 Tax=Epilithonimonas sp. TaxID=2894511 RepID=UPI002FDC9D94
MKSIRPIFLIIISFFTVLNCRKASNYEIESKVFDDIFISIVDSTLIDRRTYLGFEYSKKQIDSIKKDSLNRIVAFTPKLGSIDSDDLKKIPKDYKSISDSVWSFTPEKYNTNKYIFKKTSELPFDNSYENWKNKYPKFFGVLSFSQIYFDKEMKNGILSTTYICGISCTVGYLVYIEMVNNKWKIKKVDKTWIS